MAEKVILSKQFSLDWRDLAKSWVMVVLLPIGQSVIELIKANGSFKGIEWDNILTSTAVATFLFLAQRFGSPAKVITTYSTNEKAAEVAEEIKPTTDGK